MAALTGSYNDDETYYVEAHRLSRNIIRYVLWIFVLCCARVYDGIRFTDYEL